MNEGNANWQTARGYVVFWAYVCYAMRQNTYKLTKKKIKCKNVCGFFFFLL